jgi:hypothetical protein
MKLTGAIFQRDHSEKINTGGALLLLAAVVVVSFAFSLWHAEWFFPKRVDHGTVQETLGDWIQVLGRYDQAREAELRQQWNETVQTVQAHWIEQPGRLQETLGLSIAYTARNIWMEKEGLRSAIAAARASLDQFKTGEPARWQEKLGAAVLAAYRYDPSGGAAFLAAFDREMYRQRKIEDRIAARMESDLGSLTAQEMALRDAIPGMYREAVESAHRSARMYDDSHRALARSTFEELNAGLSWQRRPADYAETALVVRENLTARPGVGGFVEYGWPALIGLAAAMIWLGVTIPGDPINPQTPEPQNMSATLAAKPRHEEIEVGVGPR